MSGDATPSVSVFALCYNHARFVIECLDSIDAQTCQDFELIVSDDASQDGSAELVASWIATRRAATRFVRHVRNRGLCPTIAELMQMARGRYIAMVATDDLWEPDRLATTLQALEAHEDCAVAYADALQIDERGAVLDGTFLEAHGYRGRRPPTGMIFHALADGNFIPAMTTLIRADAIRAVGGYDTALSYEDYDMWLRLAHRYPFLHVPRLVARYRIVSTSLVRTVFANPTAHHQRTLIRIVDKWVNGDALSRAQRERWVHRRLEAAYGLFVHGERDAGRELIRSAVLARRPVWLALGALAAVGLKRRHLQALRALRS
jgi:glycosyltransferase involved in cell wall biosynthesis